MNQENALAEEVRQYNQNYQLELDKYNESIRQYNASLAEEQRQFDIKEDSGVGKIEPRSSDDNTVTKPTSTGLKLGDVLPKNTVSELGLSKDANIISSDGNYYVKEGSDYIDITSLEQQITSAQNTTNKYNNVTERKKMIK